MSRSTASGARRRAARSVRLHAACAAALLASPILPVPCVASHYDASWIGGAAGNWNVAPNWSCGIVPINGSHDFDVFIDASAIGHSAVTLNISGSIVGLSVSAGDELLFANGVGLTVGAGFLNAGRVLLGSTGNYTDLYLGAGTTSLSGGGIVQLQGAARLYGTGRITNLDNTIRGFGDFGIGNIAITNAGLISADVSGAGLNIDPANVANALINNGTMQATTGGVLVLRGVGAGAFINNNVIQALSGSEVRLQEDVSITGGILTTAGTGAISVLGGHMGWLSSLANSGNIVISNGGHLGLGGTITNNGSISSLSSSTYADIQLSGGTVTLAGSGTVNLQNNARIRGSGTLVNSASQTIRGAGEIGIGQIALVNAGVISADINSASLLLDPVNVANAMVNSGTMQAVGGGAMVLRGAGGGGFVNTGTILANGGTVYLQEGAWVSGGTLTGLAGSSIRTVGGHGASLYDLTNAGHYIGENSSTTGIAGTITNNGTFTLASTGSGWTSLSLEGGTVTLAGSGAVNLQLSSRILGSGTLVTAAGQTIRGSGNIGIGQIAIVNNGLISADVNDGTQSFGLYLDPANTSLGLVNNGIFQARLGGTLVLQGAGAGAFYNNGTIQALNASEVRLQEGASVIGGTITTIGSGSISVLAGHSAYLSSLANSGNIIVSNSASLGIYGVIANTGSINLNSTGNYTDLVLQGGTVSLTGAGAVNMQNAARINGSGILVNSAGQPIRGAGNIGIGQIAMVNNGVISADVNNGTQSFGLYLDPINTSLGFVNNGTYQARLGGTLVLQGAGAGAFTNTNGVIRAQDLSEVRLQEEASIIGGTLTSAASGSINVLAGHGAYLTNLTNTGNIVISNSGFLGIGGTILNNGSITANSAANYTDLVLQGGLVALEGTGTVNLRNYARIRGSNTLSVSASQTIRGAGEIGIGQMAILNTGIISADIAGAGLNIDPANVSSALVSAGTMQAFGGGVLVLRGVGGGAFINNGTIKAMDSSEVRLQEDASIIGGLVTTVGSGSINVLASHAGYFTDLTTSGRVIVSNGSALGVYGTITNSGSITLNSAANYTDLVLQGGNVTLAGPGVVSMQNAARIRGGATLSNAASHIIRGAGEIGIGQAAIVNAGLIDASISGAGLYLDPANVSNAMVNTGTLRASQGTLVLRGVGGGSFYSAGGAIDVLSTGSLITTESATLIGGTITLNGMWSHASSSYATFPNVRGTGTLDINTSALLVITPNGEASGTSRVGALSIASSGRLDLMNNDLVIDYSGASPLTSVRSWIGSAYNAGAWSGAGITTSLGTNTVYALGYAESTKLFSVFPAVFSGQTVDATSLLVKYTYFGDATLDGKVDVGDLGKLATSWQQPGFWTEGDFNYDGTVNVGDLGLLATNWQKGITNPPPLGPSFAEALAAMGLPNGSIPEPGIVPALALAAWSLRRMRR